MMFAMSNPVEYSIEHLADVSKDIPNMVVQLSFLVMSGIIVLVFAFAKNLKGARIGVMTTLLIEYMFLILGSTVIYRTSGDTYMYKLTPFWSYVAIADGQKELIEENLLNVALGIPFGFLLSFICTKNALLKSFLFGAAFSACIELSQLFFNRGLCEFDDLFHNTLGSVVGCGIGMLMIIGIRKVMGVKFFEPPSSSSQGGRHISHQASLLPEERGCNRPQCCFSTSPSLLQGELHILTKPQ